MRTLSLAALLLAPLCLAACLDEATASTSAAVGDEQSDARANHRPPPQEALDACKSSTSGDTCGFDIDGHHIDGICRAPSSDVPLACVPDHPLPPKEAFDACASSSSGATCSFDIDGHHIDGTCRSPSNDVPLACAPTNPTPR